jgi:hypothetical protein
MAALNDAKTVAAGFGNQVDLVSVEYNFSNDTGAVADYDVITADGSILVELVNVDVETAVTSGGALVVDLGKGAGGTDFWSDKAVAALTIDAQIPADTVGTIVELADGEKIVLGLEVSAALTGKFHMMFKIYKRQK